MTQEEKAKRYNEAIKAAKSLCKITTSLSIKEYIESIFPELRESEDEKISREITEFLVDLNNGEYERPTEDIIDEWLLWLEKQGNSPIKWNKNTKDCKPNVNHSVLMKTTHGIAEGEWHGSNQWFQYRWSSYVKDSDVTDWIELSNLENHDKQNPVDKVEPKFKVGDWVVENITNGIFVGKITSINTCFYGVDGLDGNWYHIDFFEEEQMHLWTIQDAKDGDVLTNKSGAIFINAGNTGEDRVTLDCYCYLSVQGEFCIEEHKTGSWFYKTEIYPATKEQRNLLFSKMKEAGYEWNAEKKELKKIEQKPQTELPKGEDYAIDGL